MPEHFPEVRVYLRRSDEIDKRMHAVEIYLQSCDKVPAFIVMHLDTCKFEFFKLTL